MQTDNYKDALKDSLRNLIQVNTSIFDSLVPIALAGELNEWNKMVSVGETYTFDFEMFKNCDDVNIQLLVKLILKIDETFETLKNINCIELEENKNG